MSAPTPRFREDLVLLGIFIGALLVHGWLVTRNLTSPFMPGHEFRQAQTAITSYYIDREDNFGLFYETPIVGKPWVSVLMEVPVYEWSVVGLSRATGLPHYVAARVVSVTCFYLMLPALYLLLGRFQLARPKRLLVLAVILTGPVYIFYSRAFLMESMELMCCAWFLLGFVEMMNRRRWPWFLLAAVAGTAAALIKSVTLAVWLLPAAGYAAWMLWRDLRARTGWGAPAATVFWALAGVVMPLGALDLWIELTDPLKAAHASAWIFTAKNLSQGNWGLVEVGARFSAKTWATLLQRWQDAILPPWLIIAILVTGVAWVPSVRGPVVGLAAVFFLAQLLFPFAYAYQDYYYYACAVFLLAAFGFLLVGLLESRLPRWAGWLAVAALLGAQLNHYWWGYRPHQMVVSTGGFAYTEVMRDCLPRDAVIIVAGADWCAVIPFYAQHRALMIRRGLEFDQAYLRCAFDDLADEDVAALVLLHDSRNNRELAAQATGRFGLEATPSFSHRTADVYCHPRYMAAVRKNLNDRNNYGGELTVGDPKSPPTPSRVPYLVFKTMAETTFAMVSPAPIRAHFSHGTDHLLVDGGATLFAHPDSSLWLRAPRQASRIEWEFGIASGAYEKEGDKTDGVVFAITGLAGGKTRPIFDRLLDPAKRPADRGTVREVISYEPLPGELLFFTTRSGGSLAYDWAYWRKIEVK